MKLWLDDQIHDPDCPARHAPPGWAGVSTVLQACRLLKTGKVTDIDFDHDLGQVANDRGGYLVARFILKGAAFSVVPRLRWAIHSANPVGRKNIADVMHAAERYWAGDGREV